MIKHVKPKEIAPAEPASISAGDSTAMLSAIIQTSPDGLITIDEQGAIQSFNPAAERIFGYAADEVLGRNVHCLMPPPYQEAHDGYLDRYRRTGERRIIGIGREVTARHKDGHIFPIDLAVGEVDLHSRRLFAGFVRDISDRHEAEEDLHKLRQELLHVSRLSEMGEMASGLAHELNQPLTAIINYLEACKRLLARDGTNGQDQTTALMQKASEQAARAGQIIQHLRRFITKGETERRVETINPVVREAAQLALVGAHQRGVVTAFHLADGLPDIPIDRIQIQQVVTNLVRNAVDALADADRKEITVRTWPAGSSAIQVDVIDTGPGLADEVAGRLFEPFVTTKENGIGIGLSICHTIIEAHGGKLWATANPKGGAMFHLILPTDQRDEA